MIAKYLIFRQKFKRMSYTKFNFSVVPTEMICINKGNSKLKVGDKYLTYIVERIVNAKKCLSVKYCYEVWTTRPGYYDSEGNKQAVDYIGRYDMKKFFTQAEWREKQIDSILN